MSKFWMAEMAFGESGSRKAVEMRWGLIPSWAKPGDNQPMAFAGIWEFATGQASAAIITTQAAEETKAIYDRMPATVAMSDWRRWLAPTALTAEESKRISRCTSKGPSARLR
jgi:putative SOS response-associated peptidase YedK